MARMGSGGSGAPGKPVKVVKRAAPKKVVRRAPPLPVTDVQSGHGYPTIDKPRTVRAAGKVVQPSRRSLTGVQQHGRITQAGIGRSSPTRGVRLILAHPQYAEGPQRSGPSPFMKAVGAVVGAVRGVYPSGGGDYTKGGAPGGTIVAGGPGSPAWEVVNTNVHEAVKHPGRTIKDLGGMVAGTVGAAGDVGLPVLHAAGDLVTGHPGSALKDVGQSGKAAERFATGAAKDYSYRYGPLLHGDSRTYEKRVHERGAAPGLVDLATAATVGGGAVRPVVRTVIKKVPGGDEFLNAARPKLRTSGGKAVSQTLSHKPSRVIVQRGVDRVRQLAQDRASQRGEKLHVEADGTVIEARKPALQPKNPVRKSVERHNRKVAKQGGIAVRVPKRPQEVVPLIKSGPLDSLGAARSQRIAVSRESAKAYALNRHEQGAEIAQGADRAIAALPAKQRRAAFHTVQGLLPIHGTLADIKQALAAREAQLVAAGAPKGAGVLRGQAELATVRYLQHHVDEVFSPAGLERLRAFHANEVERGVRVAKDYPGARPATLEARRYRPQGELLGIKHEPPTATAGNALERDAYNLSYVQRVKTAAAAKGLPEPAYFKHEKRPLARLSNRSAGNLARAVRGPKATDMRLFNEGRAITSTGAYTRGLRDTIKLKHQWPSVANVIEQHAFDWSHGPDGKGLTIEQLRDVIDRRRLRPEDVTFVNSGLVRSQAAAGALDAHSALGALRAGTGEFSKTERYFALPKHAADELLASTRPARKVTRLAGRVQGLQSGLILGLNPSWPQMQLAANTLQSVVGVHGNIGDYIAASSWYKRLPASRKRLVDLAGGIGVYEGHTNMPHMGSYQGALSRAAEQIGQIPLVRVGGRAVRVTDLDPRRQIFRLDNAQNNYFRRVVLYNQLKRQAYKELIADTGRAQVALRAVSDLLHGKPGDGVAGQLDRVLRDPGKVDQAARYVDSVMGDYLRFTHRERTAIKPTIMFYGFMRYATKTLFYTLPIQHPLAAEIALKLGQLHDDEIKRIFGTKDLPPWVYSRVFQYDAAGNVVRDKKTGLPLSIDLSRINPVTGPATDVVAEGPKALFGLMSPIVQAAANDVSGRVLQQNRPIRVHGSPEQPKSLSLGDMARVGLNEVISSTLPGRLVMPKGNQSDDALPFSPRPIVYKSPAARAKDRVKREAMLTGGRALEQQLVPLFVPRPDTSGITAVGGVTGVLDKEIKRLDTQAKAMRAKPVGTPGAATENGGYETRAYAMLRTRIGRLVKQRQAVLNVKPTRVRKILNRPLTSQQQIRQEIARLHKQDIHQQIQDEINRMHEQEKVNQGG